MPRKDGHVSSSLEIYLSKLKFFGNVVFNSLTLTGSNFNINNLKNELLVFIKTTKG